jgi:glycosyltransferase involved in cell wall biosynthesis
LKLVFATQQLDREHPALAATRAQVAALAERVDELVVLAAGASDGLPANVRVRSFRARGRLARGVRFESALVRELSGLRGGAVVAHMCPIYAVLAAPLARSAGVPLVLWYAHWRAGPLLRAAERSASAVATVDRRSFPLASRKVHEIGHGIAVGDPVERPAPGERLRLLALGRYSPAKGLDVVIRALAETDAGLTVYGPTLTEPERAHKAELERLCAELGVQGRVRLAGPIPHRELPRVFAAADALVNNMLAGAPDKVVYEAAAAQVPVFASNPLFDRLLEPGLRFGRDAPGDLAAKLDAFARLDAHEREALGRTLRARVEIGHAADGWARGILHAAGLG